MNENVAFPGFSLADAEIRRLDLDIDVLRVEVLDWKEQVRALVFHDTIAVVSIGTISAVLSHGGSSYCHPLIDQACANDGVSCVDFQAFEFVDFEDRVVLTVIAKSFAETV
jgi:hypothetical protein